MNIDVVDSPCDSLRYIYHPIKICKTLNDRDGKILVEEFEKNSLILFQTVL